MKIIYMLGYLLCTVIIIYLASKQVFAFVGVAEGSPTNRIRGYLFSVLLLVVTFLQFWLVTGFFSLPLVFLLAGALIAWNLIYAILGAITGFSLHEKQQKISVLSIVWAQQRTMLGCVYVIVSLLVLFITVIGSIWVFWTNPIGDSKAIIQLAFLNFMLPQIVDIPFQISFTWPLVTSAYLDDDYRNARLSYGLSSIIYSTIYLLFPIWLFQTQIYEVYQWSVPPVWLLLSIPLIIFLVSTIIPFFVGVYSHRFQAKLMISWRIKWLQGVSNIIRLPVQREINSELGRKLEELNNEIESRIKQNELLPYYIELLAPEFSNQDVLEADLETDNYMIVDSSLQTEEDTQLETDDYMIVDSSLQTEEDTQLVTTVDNSGDNATQFEAFRDFLRGRYFLSQSVHLSTQSRDYYVRMQEVIKENISNLSEWDLRFNHLSQLAEFGHYLSDQARGEDYSQYFKNRIEENETLFSGLTSKKNIISGTIITCTSSVIVWIFKTYEDEIIALIQELVKLGTGSA